MSHFLLMNMYSQFPIITNNVVMNIFYKTLPNVCAGNRFLDMELLDGKVFTFSIGNINLSSTRLSINSSVSLLLLIMILSHLKNAFNLMGEI